MKKLFTFLFLLSLFVGSFAQWKPTSMQGERLGSASGKEEFFTLDIKQLKSQLANAQESGNYAKPVVISIPVLGGKVERFNVYSAPVVVKELAAQYQLGSYAGVGIDDPSKLIRFSVSGDDFQSTIAKGGQYQFIDPANKSKTIFRVHPKTVNTGNKAFICTTEESPAVQKQIEQLYKSGKSFSNNPADFAKSSDKKYRTLRLALSVTAEYTAFFGGTAGALTQMNATLTRVNFVFEKDLALRLILQNYPTLIYTNAASDPYDAWNMPFPGGMDAWNGQLQQTLTNVVGNANYDIGHLFGSAGGGGNAGCIGCICVNPTTAVPNGKGSAYTSPGGGPPSGDSFDIDYVAHEMGHQLAGTHTFTHQIQGGGSSMEPGSGSTIMGYAGITTQNVQMNSDPYFHARSIEQIQGNLVSKTCDTETNIANNPPVIAALTPYTIPKGTAFVLTASATDPENDPMTYTWEQFDNGAQATTSANLGTLTTGPSFRSLLPGTSPTRYFPRLSSVLNGVLNNSNNLWEAVSTVARPTNFRVTVRDNHATANQQQTQFAQQTITVSNNGPFKVNSTTAFNNAASPFTWDVVGTDAAPFNSPNVKIDYTADNGATWITLLASTPNDGTEDLTFTGVTTGATVKVRVSAIDNVFYAVGPVNVTASALCTGAPPVGITVTGITGTQATVSWTAITGAAYNLQYRAVGSPTWIAINNILTTSQLLTPLAPSTTYEVQVATVCSGTPGAFSASVNFTTVGPSTLPYVQPFTNNDFTFIGTQTNKWAYGGAAGNPPNAIYISNDSGVSNAYTNNSASVAHAYKELIIPAGSTVATLAFDWKSYGNDGTTWDYMRVWLVPASFTPTAGAQITGAANRIQIGGNFQNVTAWQNYINPLVNIAPFAGATMRLVFEWRNDTSVGTNPPAAVDNINFAIPTCLTPGNMAVTNVMPTSATIGWTAPSTVPANGYQYFFNTTNTPPTSATVGTAVAGTSVNLPGLVPGTTYYWWVRAICSATDSSFWVAGPEFTPGQIGSGTATTGNLPVYSCFGYGYSQQIYTGAEVTSAVGTNQVITKIRFKVDSPVTPQSDYNIWTVFMGNTTQANFATTTSWVPYNQLQQVWSGTVPNMVAGTWVELTLNVPFIWDGVSNIVIGVDENADDWACTAQWGGYTAGTNRGMLYYSDSTNPDPAAPPTANYRNAVIPQLQLVGEPLPPCTSAAPTNLNVTGITNVSANLSWMPAQGATYVVQWRPVGQATWNTVTPSPAFSFYQLTGLTEQTQYEFRVAYVCGTVQGNFAAPVQFTTTALPYCAANPTSTLERTYISNVTVNAVGAPTMVSASTGGQQYIDYTGDPSRLVTLIMGTAGNTVSVTKAWTGTTYAAGTGVWIDFNRNGTFENAERVLTSASNTTNPVTATFSVQLPPNVYNGPLKTRMRVIVREAGNPTACGTFTYGEVEDYDVQLVEPIPCTSAAPQGLAASNMGPTTATLSWMPATGATYVLQWREVTTPASPWITVSPAPVNSFHILTNLEEQHTYEFQVAYVCNGVQGAWGGPFQFTTPPLNWCTAGSTSAPLDEHITNVTVNPTGFPISPPMVNNSGPSNYTDYYFDPTKLVTLVLGSTGNTISVEKGWVNAPSNVAVAAWIDFNRNGTFETTEQILNTSANQLTPVTATFDVPAVGYTSPYHTKMRVIARLTTIPTACGSFNFGEVEDYPVHLEEPIPCNNAAPLNVVVSAITHNSATVTWTPDPGGATYIVQYKPVGAATWTGQIPLTYLTGTYTIPNLIPATQYIVQVIALCDNVPGPPTEVPFETKCDPEPPTNFTVSAITTTSAVVSWNPVATAVYVLQYRPVGAATWTTVNVTGTTYTITGLDPYTTYEVQVASECSGAINPYSTPIVFTTLPTCEMAPVGLTVTNITMTQAQVDWNAYPGATYVFRWRKVGSSGWTTLNLTTNTYIITGLTEETQYEVQVANICNGATQQFTHPYVFTTPSLVYCDMSAASSSAEHISNVNVKPAGGTEMNNDSGASGYTSYLADPTKHIVLLQGSTGNQISISKEWANTQYNEAVTVWIDFNRNGVFSNNERILIAPANQQTPVTTTFSVPADAYVSLTNDRYVVMRVAMSRNGSPEMCSTFANGEVEDYRVRITKAMPNNIMDNNQIIVYPNPAKNTLFITKVKDGAKYKVYSAIGQLVQTGTILSNKIDVSRLINGIFVIDITDTNGESAQKKFIKE